MKTKNITRITALVSISAAFCFASATTLNAQNREDRRAQLVERFDTDGDGVLSPEERENARLKVREMRGARKGEARLTREERQERLAQIIAKYDTDGDGKLSPEERQAFINDRKAQRSANSTKAPSEKNVEN